jgi:hypothetical protein
MPLWVSASRLCQVDRLGTIGLVDLDPQVLFAASTLEYHSPYFRRWVGIEQAYRP